MSKKAINPTRSFLINNLDKLWKRAAIFFVGWWIIAYAHLVFYGAKGVFFLLLNTFASVVLTAAYILGDFIIGKFKEFIYLYWLLFALVAYIPFKFWLQLFSSILFYIAE